MTDSRNIGQYSRFHSNPAGSGLVDGVDFPHSGLLKALSVGLQNSYAILNGTTADATKNFSIVQTNSSGNTQFVVRAGTVIRDGKLMPEIATATFTQGTPSTFDEPSSGNSYFVLVVTSDSTNVLAIRGDKADTDVIPQLTAGDIPVAIIKLDASGTVDGRAIQYLTTAKSENSLTVGYDAGSTTYTETMSIVGTNDRTVFKNKIANADIRFILADNTADEKFEVVTDDDSDGDGDTTVFSIDGQGKVTIAGVDRNESDLVISKDVAGSIGRAGISLISDNSTNGQSGRLTLERTSGSSFIGMDIATDSRDGIRILTGDGSETERMRINDDGKVAIGTATVDTNSLLAVEGSISLDEISAPTSTGNRAQLYANADNELHMVDGAGVDTIFLKSGKHSIWVPSSAMTPLTTGGCSVLTQVEMTAGRPELQVLDFAADADDSCQFTVAFPKSWNEGTVTFQPFWTVTGTNTGTAVWNLTGISVDDNYAINSGYPSIAATGAKAHSGTSNDLNVSAESGALTITNASVDSVTYFKLSLDTSASSQTGTVRLIGIKLFYDINAGNDE